MALSVAERQIAFAQAKAVSLALLRGYDESQHPRDEHGRWTEDGGGATFDIAKVEAKTKANVAAASAQARAAGVTPLDGSKAEHPATIASRNPTAVGAKAEYGQPDLASMRLDPKRFDHNIGLFRNAEFYPNFRAQDLRGSTTKAADAVVAELKDNLKFLYSFADKQTQVWYDGARALVDDRAKLWGFNDASVAGVYAALSPTKDWDQNVHIADMLMETYRTQQGTRWTPEMDKKSKTLWSAQNQRVVDLVRGKTLGELTSAAEKALWIRTYDETHNNPSYRVVKPNGALGPPKLNRDGTRAKVVWQSLPAISNAVKALEANGNRDVISAAMGNAHKVRSFYNNILDPHSANGDVTIDTHAVGAALLRQVSGAHASVMHNFGNAPMQAAKPKGWEAAANSIKTGLSGTYAVYAQAYREAARELGIQPRQLQSAVWVVKRETFGTISQKGVEAVEAAWQDYHAHPAVTLAQTQRRIAALVGLGRKDERRDSGHDGAGQRSAHAPELHRAGLGSAAPGMDRRAGSGAARAAPGLELVRDRQGRAGAARGYDESEHPRDEHGRWTDSGGDNAPAREGEGAGRAEAPSPGEGSGGASAAKLTGTYRSRRATDAERSRNVEQVYELDEQGLAEAKRLGITPQPYEQLNTVSGGAERFHAAISAAKTGKYAAAVHVYDAAEYAGMDLYLSPDGLTGFARKGTDIVSLFKNPSYEAKGACHSALALAVQKGGRKLDCFDTVLPELYSKSGFRAVARLPWSDEHAPPGWDKSSFRAFNNGEPDVVFMVYDPQHVNANGLYKKDDGLSAPDYDAAVALQQQAMEVAESRPPPPLPEPKPLMSAAEIDKAIREVSKDLDFDPAAIYVDNGAPGKFSLNGKQLQAAGFAHTSRIGKDTQVITIFGQNAHPATVNGVIAHEIEHVKFETAIKRYREEYERVMAEPKDEGRVDPVMKPDGSLKPPYDEKYPAYTAMQKTYARPMDDFAVSDGVSDYSLDWWDSWKSSAEDNTSGTSAVHETLAEMSRLKHETGRFPPHLGDRLLRWRIPAGGTVDDAKPAPSDAQIARNAKVWRDLYRAVDKVWKLPPPAPA